MPTAHEIRNRNKPDRAMAVEVLMPDSNRADGPDSGGWWGNSSGPFYCDDGLTLPTDAEIDAKLDELELEWTAQQYARNRAEEYPEIGDQLDDLYHAGIFSADMAAKLKKVKDDNPKG